jgi:phosphopantetheine--protein transferase-like protein
MSDTTTLLRRTVAEFFEVDEGQVGPDFPLAGRGSIARAALDAAIRRRVGLTAKAVYSATTFGELAGAVSPGGSAAPSTAAPTPKADRVLSPSPSVGPASAAPIGCGIDIELIENLPQAADPWEDPFYRAHFTPEEIAYCLLQAEPALHFAARWCAKEALKKCDLAFLDAAPSTIEVAHDEAGAPYLVHRDGGAARRLPHAVSLSHTATMAAAIVVRLAVARASELPTPASTASDHPPTAAPAKASRGTGMVVWALMTLASLALAVLALLRTYPHP